MGRKSKGKRKGREGRETGIETDGEKRRENGKEMGKAEGKERMLVNTINYYVGLSTCARMLTNQFNLQQV